MASENGNLLRSIPKVDKLLLQEPYKVLVSLHSRPLVTRVLRQHLDHLRRRGTDGSLAAEELKPDRLHRDIESRLVRETRPYYQRVINGTGIILHTGLGRAPLPPEAVAALAERSGHPLLVELDLTSGERGSRDHGVSRLVCELTGAPAATVVNNNAGATLLILAALARGKKVITSHGELVEIGGSFRIPSVMEESGAELCAVGTTNRTHIADYERAIDDDTGMLLKVHTSNYRVVGFTKEVEIGELVELGRRRGVAVVHDLGSGCLVDLEAHGLWGEPHVSRSLDAGADLVCFSGDKLLGGPQAGIIAGTEEAVSRCRKHPLYRALRCDRLTYMALEAVLGIYREGEAAALKRIPSLARLTGPLSDLALRARRLADRLAKISGLSATPEKGTSQAGSGSMPGRDIPSWVVVVRHEQFPTPELARKLRLGDPAILPRVRDDALSFDLRTLEDEDFPLIASRLERP